MLKLLTSGFRWVDRHSAIWVFVLAGLALTSASCGIAIKHFDSIPSVQDEGFALALFNWLSDCLYEAVQVLLLNMASHEDDFNVCIGCARIFGVAFFGLVAIQAIRRLFSRSFSEFRLRTRTREIAFVAGLGRLGLQIALEESKKGRLRQLVVCGILILILGILGLIYGISLAIDSPTVEAAGSSTSQNVSFPPAYFMKMLWMSQIGLSLLSIVGVISTLQKRRYIFAILAAYGIVIPCFSPLFGIGIPLGAWAMIILLHPEVRARFR